MKVSQDTTSMRNVGTNIFATNHPAFRLVRTVKYIVLYTFFVEEVRGSVSNTFMQCPDVV